MEVLIGDDIRDEYLVPFGIPENDVQDAVLNEEVRKIVPLKAGKEYRLFLKNKGDHYLLVTGEWNAPRLTVVAVFKILPKTIKETGTSNPLLVLSKLADECGYDIQLGDQRLRFVTDASIPVPKITSVAHYQEVVSRMVRPIITDRSAAEVVLADFMTNLRQGEKNDFIDVANAYAISGTKYFRYLKGS